MAKKKTALPTPEPRDTRSLLERAAQDDPVILVHFELVESDGLLHCRLCDYVTRQPVNARRHVPLRHTLEETLEELKPTLEEMAGAVQQYAKQHGIPTLSEYVERLTKSESKEK